MDLNEIQQFNCAAFVVNNNIVNENGNPIEFKLHKFLVDPYMDNTPKQVIRKAGQVGWSTLAIIRSLHLAQYLRANIIYTLPSKSIVKDFVTPKVDPLIENNAALKAMVGEVDSTGLKKIGDRFVYFRSSWDEASGIAISADILINDELDRSNQKAIRTYKTRLDASKMTRPDLGWHWQFSNPTIPSYGVDELYGESDQKKWMIKCPHCNQYQELVWPESVCFEREEYVCQKCDRILTPEDRANGQWIKSFFGRDISGYTINQLMVPWHSAKKIIEDSRGDQSVFYNFTLGLPYQAKDSSVSRMDIVQNITSMTNPRVGNAMGVDVGKIKHYVIGNRYGIFRIGTTESWEELEDLRNQYNAHCVIDAMPNPDEPAKLAKKYRGKVFVHYYAQDKKQLGIVRWGEGDSFGTVQSDRTKIIDALVADFANKDINFNIPEEGLEEYIAHWGFMYRVIVDNDKGQKIAHWLHAEGKPDHYAHASVYFKIALEKTLSNGAIVMPEQPNFKQPQIHGGRVEIDMKQFLKGVGKEPRDWRHR